MTIKKPHPQKPYVKSYELLHKLGVLDIKAIETSIQTVKDPLLQGKLNEIVKMLRSIITYNDLIQKVESSLHKLREDQTNELIVIQSFLEQSQLTDLFKKSLTQNLTVWEFNPLDNVKQFYRAIYSHFTVPKICRMLKPQLNELYKRFQITSKEGVLRLLIDDKIIRTEMKYDCPRCDETLSLDGDEWICMQCTYSVSKDDIETVCSGEIEVYKDVNFEKIKELI